VRVLDQHRAHEDVFLPCANEREDADGDQSDAHLWQHHEAECLAARRPVGHRAHLDVPGHCIEEALQHEHVEGKLDRGEDEHHADDRIEQADPVQDQE
jgi:hypothetical protein